MMRGDITINNQAFFLEICCRCKTPFAIDNTTYKAALRGRESFTFYCPFGHGQSYTTGESELDKMRRDRDRLAQKIAERDDTIRQEREAKEAAERSASAYKGKVTRLKNRAAAGVCPCCNRQFQNLHNHMKTKHPEFQEKESA